MYKVSETVLPIYINGQCPIIKICSDVTLNLSSKDNIPLLDKKASLFKQEIFMQVRANERYIPLTHISLASFLWDIGKQCRPRSDATERGV